MFLARRWCGDTWKHGTRPPRYSALHLGPAIKLGWAKKENSMRIVTVAALVMTASGAIAGEIEDAQRLALQGRDSYWNCLAREYARDTIRTMSEQDFTRDIASVCGSERQNFRVTLVDYLSMQFPDTEAGAHMTTANKAIELAQKDIVTAFLRHKAPN
jgi:hypothetical protein